MFAREKIRPIFWQRRAAKSSAWSLPLGWIRCRRELRKDPTHLPRNLLFRNYIRGEGDQDFLVKAPMAKYDVLFISPDHNSKKQSFEARDGILRVRFPHGDWSISGLVIKGVLRQNYIRLSSKAYAGACNIVTRASVRAS